jgi:O-antigen/teichoic acid export membrane protein
MSVAVLKETSGRSRSVRPEDAQQQGVSSSEPSREIRPTLRKNLVYSALGHGFYTFSQWAILAGLAKLGTPEVVGNFAFCLAVTAPLVEFTGLQLHVVIATDSRGRYSLFHYLLLRALTGLFAFLLVGLLLHWYPVPSWLSAAVFAMTAAKLVEGCSLICHGRFQRAERMDWVARSQVLRGILAVTAVCGLFAAGRPLSWGIAMLGISWGLVYLLHDLPVARRIESSGTSVVRTVYVGEIFGLARLSFPLGIAVGLNTLSSHLPRYFVGVSLGAHALGIFAALAYLGVGARLFYLPVIQTVMPRLAHLFHSGKLTAFFRLLLQGLALAVGLSLAGWIVLAVTGKPLLRLIYTQEYAQFQPLVLVLWGGVALHFLASVLIGAIQASHRFAWVLACYGAGNLVLVATLAAGVASWGLTGAAMATVLAGLGELLAATFFVWLLLTQQGWHFRSQPVDLRQRTERRIFPGEMTGDEPVERSLPRASALVGTEFQ